MASIQALSAAAFWLPIWGQQWDSVQSPWFWLSPGKVILLVSTDYKAPIRIPAATLSSISQYPLPSVDVIASHFGGCWLVFILKTLIASTRENPQAWACGYTLIINASCIQFSTTRKTTGLLVLGRSSFHLETGVSKAQIPRKKNVTCQFLLRKTSSQHHGRWDEAAVSAEPVSILHRQTLDAPVIPHLWTCYPTINIFAGQVGWYLLFTDSFFSKLFCLCFCVLQQMTLIL